MKDLITFKNLQIEALHDALADLEKYVTQLETYVFELTDKDSPEEYKAVIRKEVFNIDSNE